jgi:hypothetical protein
MKIYKHFVKLGVPSSDVTLYSINETKEDKIPKKWKENDFLLNDIPTIKGFYE